MDECLIALEPEPMLFCSGSPALVSCINNRGGLVNCFYVRDQSRKNTDNETKDTLSLKVLQYVFSAKELAKLNEIFNRVCDICSK